jgi:16S rRNA processing protein RimM
MLLKIGYIEKTFGKTGEVIVASPPLGLNIIKEDSKVCIGYSENFVETLHIKSFKKSKHNFKLTFKEIKSPEEAQRHIDKNVFIEESLLQDIENENFLHSPIGYEVIDEEGSLLGIAEELWELPANDVLVIKGEAYRINYPYLPSYILNKDNKSKVITLAKLEGIEELYY